MIISTEVFIISLLLRALFLIQINHVLIIIATQLTCAYYNSSESLIHYLSLGYKKFRDNYRLPTCGLTRI